MTAIAPLPLVRELIGLDVDALLAEWRWRLPGTETPLFVTALADWVLGEPDGSIWLLDSIEGDYRMIATSGVEYNAKKASRAWLNEVFSADWYDIAIGNGLVAGARECIGWKTHPVIGGAFEVSNLRVFDAVIYHSLMGQLHRQLP